MKKLLAFSVWLLVVSLGCMTSAMVSDLPEVSPTVAVVDQLPVSDEAVYVGSDELQEWIPERFEYVVCADVLHVRSGPRFGASVQGYKYRGDAVTVTEFFDGWGMIAPARWVKLEYLC